jgi:hypothetical protein
MTKISKFLNRKPNGEKTLLFVSIWKDIFIYNKKSTN